jgi:hypothetical protein
VIDETTFLRSERVVLVVAKTPAATHEADQPSPGRDSVPSDQHTAPAPAHKRNLHPRRPPPRITGTRARTGA